MNTSPRSPHLPISHFFSAVLAGLAILFTSCAATPVEKGALGGAVLGGVIGGIAEDDAGGVAKGAAIGALAGAVAGKIVEHRARKYSPPPYQEDPTQVKPLNRPGFQSPTTYPAPNPPPAPPDYPVATPTDHPDRVISPHPPNNLINVEGFRSGDLAIDPTTEKVFRVP